MSPVIQLSFIFSGFIAVISSACFGVETDRDRGFEKYQALIQKNPFLPKSEALKPVLKKSETSNYRFTGFVIRGDDVRVGIENLTSNRSYLMAAGDKIEEDPSHLAIKDIHVKEKYVTIYVNSEPLRLDMSEFIAPPMAMMNSPPPDMAPASNIEGGGNAAPRPIRRRIIIPTRN